MKKITFLRSLLAILLLAVSTGYAWADEASITFFRIYSENSGSLNGQTIAVNKNVELLLQKNSGNTNPQYYKSGTALRLYYKNSMAITVADGYIIESVTMTTATGGYVMDATSTVTAGVMSIDGGTVTVTGVNNKETVLTYKPNGTSGHVRIQSVTVTYSSTGSATEPTLSVGAINFGTIMKGDVASEAVAVQANNFAGDVTYTYAITEGADAFAVDAAGNVSVIATAFGTYEGELSVTATDGTNELTKTAGLSVVVRELYEPANGTYAIKYGNYYMKNEVYSSHYVTATEFESSASLTDEYKFIITGVDGGYTIQNSQGSYVGIVTSGSYRNLKPQLTDAVVWTFYKGADGAVEAYCEDVDANYYMAFILYNNTTPEFTAENTGGNFPTFEYIEEAQVIVADPVFSHEAGEVVFGTEVTLTAAEGAIITYSVNDGDTYVTTTNTATVVIDQAEVEIYAFASIDDVLSEGVTYTYNATLPITFSHPEGGVLPGTVVTISTLDGAEMIGEITVAGVTTEFVADGNTYNVTINDETEIYVLASIADITAEATANYTISNESEATFDFTDPTSLNPSFEAPAKGGEINLTDETLVSGNISFTVTSASTKTRIYNSNGNMDLRVYKNGGSITLTGNNVTIKEIVFTSANASLGNWTADCGNYTDGVWTGSAESVTFTASETVRVNTITVTYDSNSAYAENIVSNNVFYFRPTTFNADDKYAAYFINKNTDKTVKVVGTAVTALQGFEFFLSAGNTENVTRAAVPTYTHVVFERNGEEITDELYYVSGIAYNETTELWEEIGTGIDRVDVAGGIEYTNGVVAAEGAIEVYNVGGAIVARGNDNVDLRALNAGVYIVRNGDQVRKVVR